MGPVEGNIGPHHNHQSLKSHQTFLNVKKKLKNKTKKKKQQQQQKKQTSPLIKCMIQSLLFKLEGVPKKIS